MTLLLPLLLACLLGSALVWANPTVLFTAFAHKTAGTAPRPARHGAAHGCQP